MIEIDEQNANLAMIKMYDYLKPYLESGWKGGIAIALVDNWKNVYTLNRGTETLNVEFDLRKTIPKLPQERGSFFNAQLMSLTMVSPTLASETAAEIIGRVKEQEPKDNHPKGKGWFSKLRF
jgi:hypothetical protein